MFTPVRRIDRDLIMFKPVSTPTTQIKPVYFLESWVARKPGVSAK